MTVQDKAEMMRRNRAEHKAKGHVQFRRWCTPEEKKKLEQYADKLQKSK